MKIALLGDLGFFGKYTIENKSIKEYFKDVKKVLDEVDYVIGNLEVPLTSESIPKGSKSAYLKSNPKNVELLNYLNIKYVSLANNHIYDYGLRGYKDTKKILEKAEIKYFGIENKKEIIKQDKNNISLSGYCCYSTNSLGYLENNKYGINELNYEKVKRNMKEDHKNGLFNIVSFHIGEEHVHYPNYDHIKLARKLSDEIPYVFYGHHPHVLQGIEKYKDSLHLYSLGNFCFDDVYTYKSKNPLIKQNRANKESCIVILEIEKNCLLDYKVVPIHDNGDKITLGSKKIEDDIKEYSGYLKVNEKQFKTKRNEIRSKFLNDRKRKRDLFWYLKRLNIKSYFILKDLKMNQNKYNKFLLKGIKDD